ncbi:hypothetical protein [Paenibacillus koleovorans]|uniref:hypothetical protein n=1 Tax=Paenibacillus koleovorans TaxID=121608 RepID=UPI000FDC3BBC|nr:hypothetical protein [Paenibacillus koleovorans]
MKSVKRYIPYLLCFLLVSSSFGSFSVLFAAGIVPGVMKESKNSTATDIILPEHSPVPPTEGSYGTENSTIRLDVPSIKRNDQATSPTEVAEWFQQGYGMKDLLKANELSARSNQSIQSLLDAKKDEQKDWSAIEQKTRMNVPAESMKYHLQQEEYNSLLRAGYDAQDVGWAYSLGLKYGQDPKQLLEEQKSKKIDWYLISKGLESQDKMQVIQLIDQFPNEYLTLQQSGLTVQQQWEILYAFSILYSSNRKTKESDMKKREESQLMVELIDTYKRSGLAGIVEMQKQSRSQSDLQTSRRMASKGLLDSDTKGIPEITLEKLEVIAERQNLPLKDVIQQYKETRQESSITEGRQ